MVAGLEVHDGTMLLFDEGVLALPPAPSELENNCAAHRSGAVHRYCAGMT
jgi:hypothetical protein